MEKLTQTLAEAIKGLFDVDLVPELDRPDEQFGDYATNAAMQLAGRLQRNPREIAEELAERLRKDLGGQVKEINIAGPGFINITLSDQALYTQAATAQAAQPRTYAGKTVVAEYSDPNPFKVLHAGHLYTTIIGDAISRLFEAAGGTVHRLNYGGDVGLHVGKAMWGIIKHLNGENPERLAEIPEAERPNWVTARYVEGNTAYEEDEQAKEEIVAVNQRVYALHAANDHESPFAQIYWTCRDWSYQGFDKLYEQLGTKPFERYLPESEVTPPALEMVERALKAGVLEVSDGAVVFKGEEHGLHTRVFRNSAGLPTYEAKDLGLATVKWERYQFDKSVIITANDIVEYMKVILKVLSHFYPEVVERSAHLTHGMIKLQGGKKMSSRKGNVLLAVDIIEAAIEANKATTGKDDPPTAIGAIKYAFLRQRIGGDIIYDPTESVSLEGNSGPYLQYAHARARSILAKAEKQPSGTLDGFEGGERTLARKISEYPEAVSKAVAEFMPHHICTYLYELAQTFNRFYEHNRVVGDLREAERLKLVTLYADILRDGLGLLGITAPDRM